MKIISLKTLLLSFVSSLAFISTSSYSQTGFVDSYIIIIGGGTTEAALPPLQAKFKSSGFSKLVPLPNNSILTMDSNNISGLNPGFHIAVLGICTQKEKAQSLRDVANLTFPGTYIKQVQVHFSQLSCPDFRSPEDRGTEGFRLVNKMRVAEKQAWPKWYIYEQRVHREEDDTTYKSLLLQVRTRDGVVLSQYYKIGRFTQPGAYSTHDLTSYEFTGGRSFLVLQEDSDWIDMGSHGAELLFFNGSKIRGVTQEKDGGIDHYVEYTVRGNSWKEIEVTSYSYRRHHQEKVKKNTAKFVWDENTEEYKEIN